MTPSSFAGFTQLLADQFGVPWPILVAIGAIAFTAWVIWRTRSSHLILSRVWRLVCGRPGAEDPDIACLLRERSQLTMIRFFTGLPVRTLRQGKALTKWARRNDEDLADVKACGNLFDLEACELRMERLPSPVQQLGRLAVMTVFSLGLAISLLGVSTERALLKLKSGENWFLLSQEVAVHWLGQARITRAQCTSQINQLTDSPFTQDERTGICAAFEQSQTPELIASVVKQQRYTFAVISVLLAALALASMRAIRQGAFATAMARRLGLAPSRRAGTSAPGNSRLASKGHRTKVKTDEAEREVAPLRSQNPEGHDAPHGASPKPLKLVRYGERD